MDLITFDLSPESALFNAASSTPGLPKKVFEFGTSIPSIKLRYQGGINGKAYFRIPLPALNSLGEFSPDLNIDLSIVTDTVITTIYDKVQFGVRYGFIEKDEDDDQVLSTQVLSPVIAVTGSEVIDNLSINLPNAFLAVSELTNPVVIVLEIERKTAIANSLVGSIDVLKSVSTALFKSNLEIYGGSERLIVHNTTSGVVLTRDAHINSIHRADTTTLGNPINFVLPVMNAGDEGRCINVIRNGTYGVTIAPAAGQSLHGTGSPYTVPLDGDHVVFKWIGNTQWQLVSVSSSVAGAGDASRDPMPVSFALDFSNKKQYYDYTLTANESFTFINPALDHNVFLRLDVDNPINDWVPTFPASTNLLYGGWDDNYVNYIEIECIQVTPTPQFVHKIYNT